MYLYCYGFAFHCNVLICLGLCPPLSSDALITRCTYGASTVDCHLPMLPGTSATYQCRDSHREYSDLTEAGVYKRTIYCKQDGWWTYQLPECEPSKEFRSAPSLLIIVSTHLFPATQIRIYSHVISRFKGLDKTRIMAK